MINLELPERLKRHLGLHGYFHQSQVVCCIHYILPCHTIH